MENETKELTFGEKAVGLTFNPSGDVLVNQAKKLCAEIIDICNDVRNMNHVPGAQNEQGRLFSIAITQAQQAQMWIVKALTWKD